MGHTTTANLILLGCVAAFVTLYTLLLVLAARGVKLGDRAED